MKSRPAPSASATRFRRKPLITALEPRLLLDGAAVATTVDMATDVDYQDQTADQTVHSASAEDSVHFTEAAAPTSTEPARREVAFVDTQVQDYQALVDGMAEGVEVFLIDAGRNGLEQMLAHLQGQKGIDAIHVYSHGNVGEISIGSLTLNGTNLDQYSSLLTQLGETLSANGDVMLYGCYVGADSQGQSFLNDLATLTGADVAASDDLTGSSELGGDWSLESVSGTIESDSIAPSNFNSTLAAPTISGFGPASYTENTAATIIDSSITLSGGSNYGGGFIRIVLDQSNSADQFTLTNAADFNAAGAISFVGSTVYLGNGAGRDAIGSIDAVENGLNGKALKINFTANFTNPSFESGTVGWTIGTERVVLGTTVIAGRTTPTDTSYPSPSAGDNASMSSQSYNYTLATSGSSDGSNSLRLYNDGVGTGYHVLRGPYAYSSTFTASAGDTLFFDWKAQGGSDAYDAFGYLLNIDTGATTIVLNSTGANASVTTNWATASVNVPTNGNYRFVFVAGTWDATGGTVSGGSLYIDNVKVFGNKVNDAVAQTIISQIAYQNTAEDAPASRNLTLQIRDGSGATSSSVTTLTVNNVNDAPSFSSGATLIGVQEGATNPVGATVLSLFGNKFVDPDNTYSPTDTLKGIVVVADASAAEQGKWQYSTDGTNWYDVSSTAVSTSAGLVLSETTKVRFLPNGDYPAPGHLTGAPGGLTVHAVDSSYAGSYTSGATRHTFNTTTDGGTSAVSAAGVTLSTTVSEVNDAPRFTGTSSSPYTSTYTETAAEDSSGGGVLPLATGQLTASDVEGDSFTFGIRGGVTSGSNQTRVGLFGTLNVDTTTGAWTYTPNAKAINALQQGAVATDNFEFKVTDSLGAMSVQTFTATINGTNDTPILTTALADQSINGSGSWVYQLPANAFTDAEGTGLTYSAVQVDADGANPRALPGNLTFDPVTRTFSGNPGADGEFYIRIVATDDDSATTADDVYAASESDIFKLTVSDFNEPPVYNGGLGPKVFPSAPWSVVIPDTSFSDTDALTWAAFVGATNLSTSGTSALSFDPVTRTLSGNGSALPGGVVEIRVTDTAGNTASALFSVAIATTATDSVNPNGPDPIPDTIWTGSGRHTYTIPADAFAFDGTDSTIAFTATLDGGALLPDWLSFNTTSGTFTGNPPTGVTGPFDITVTATKGTALASDTFRLTLTNTNDAPVLQSVGAADQSFTTDGVWSYTFGELFTDPDGAPNGGSTTDGITYSVQLADGTPAPSWLTIDSGTRTLSGNPPAGEAFINLKLMATDAGGATAETTFTLNLQDVQVYGVNNPGGVTITDLNGGGVNQGDTLRASAADTEGISGTVVYQWQMSGDNGATWTDIANANGQDFTLAQAQVGKQVRVQVFYTDGGGVAESPVANALGPVINVNDPAALSIDGGAAIGNTLTAELSDDDGLTQATIAYQWQRSTDNSTWVNITDATYRTYNVTDADGGKYLRVTATYTDDEGTVETPVTAGTFVQLGAKAPVANSDAGSISEAGGVANATYTALTVTGNLLGNDTDENGSNTITGVTAVRQGGIEGLGQAATETDAGTTLTLQGFYGTLVVTKSTGAYVYTLNQTNPSVEELTVGSSIADTFNYTIRDNSNLTDTSTLTITINGANDTPTITVNDVDGGITENSVLTDSGSIDFRDVDLSDRPTATEVTKSLTALKSDGTTPLVLTAEQRTALENAFAIAADPGNTSRGTIAWTYAISEAELDFLAEGEVVTAVFTITVSDGHGGTVAQDVTITVNGTNDTPVISGGADTAALTETDTTLTASGSMTVTDVDLTDTVAITVDSVSTSGTFSGINPLTNAQLKAMLAASATSPANIAALAADPSAGSTFDWTFTSGAAGDAAFNFLREGETLILTYTLKATDSSGASSTASSTSTVTITITGTNENVTVSATPSGGYLEAVDASAQTISESGTVSFADVDLTDRINITFASNNDIVWKKASGAIPGTLNAALINQLIAGFQVGAVDAPVPGSVPWTYNIADADLDFLNIGDTITFSYTVTATDSSGATATDVVRFTFTGTNDVPVADMVVIDQTWPFGKPYELDIAQRFSDRDARASGEDLDFTLTGLPGGLSYNAETGLISGIPTGIGKFTITMTATDRQGTSVTRQFVLEVLAPPQPPVMTPVADAPPPPSAPALDTTQVTNDTTPLPSGTVSTGFSTDPVQEVGFMAPTRQIVEPSQAGDGSTTAGSAGPGNVSAPDDGASAGNSGTERILVAEGNTRVSEVVSPDGRVTSVRASIQVEVAANGQVVFNDVQKQAFGIVGLSVSSISSGDNGLSVSIADAARGQDTQFYTGELGNGESLPDWITVDQTTGEIAIGNPPPGIDAVTVRVKAIGSDGKVRMLDIELKLSDLLKRKSLQDLQPDSTETLEPVGFVPLTDQAAAEVASSDGYGERLIALLEAA